MPRRLAAGVLAALLVAALLVTAAAPAAATDPFYSGLLRDGILAYDRGVFPEAARTLRLACFGLLEEPAPLGSCLVRLALAQSRAGDAEGFQDTFRRVVEVEERFTAYTKADLPVEVRTAFEERVKAAVPAATLSGLPAFQTLVAKKEQAAAPGPRDRRRQTAPNPTAPSPATGAPAAPEPAPARATPPAPTPRGSTPAPAAGSPAAPAPATAPSPPAITPAERQALAEARRLLDGDADAAGLRQALKLAREVADAHSADREAQHLAAEAAYRNARWEEAVAYFQKGGDPGDTRPVLLFYLAVALFEQGDTQRAAATLRRALPKLDSTPYVQSYTRKILGS